MPAPAPMSILSWVALPLFLTGCGVYGPCDHQRGIVLYAALEGGDVRTVDQTEPLSQVAFWEHQRDGLRREVHWIILSPPLRGSVMEVHLHQGSQVSEGVLLYTFPLEAAGTVPRPGGQGSDSVLQRVSAGAVTAYGEDEGAWYKGTVPFPELLQRLYREPTYVDVHTDSVPSGEFKASLGTPQFFLPPSDPAVWQPIHCS